MISLKSPRELEWMARAGELVARLLDELRAAVRPGVTTLSLDRLAERLIREWGAQPAFKGYLGYPATICTSVNEGVVHGIPNERRLEEGDLVGVDAGVQVEGFFSDAAVTMPVGRVSEEAQRLIAVTEEALNRGIAQARSGNRISDISHAIQTYVEAHGFSVVRQFVGHGIGSRLHEEPEIPNFGVPGLGPAVQTGMVVAIEPMVNAGGPDVEILPDGWTVVTKDRRMSAHFEHTVSVGPHGPEVLSRCRKKTALKLKAR